MRLFVGVDGGGSRTQAVVLSDTLQVLGKGEAGPSNPYVAGAEHAAQNCRQAVHAAFADALRIEPGLTPAQIDAWGFGLAGVRRAPDAAAMRVHLLKLVGSCLWILDTDAAAAHAGAFGGGRGVVLSAGTGAIAYASDGAAQSFYADGWGPLLGDEGGGYWIGMEALKAVCRAFDGRRPETRLSPPLLSSLGVRDVHELVQKIYREGFEREEIAKLSRVVFNAAANGANDAIDIRDRAVECLAETAAAAARALLQAMQKSEPGGASQELPVALRGGLFEDDDFRARVGFRAGERLIEMKRDFLPISSWRIAKPQYAAAIGAALMAQKLVQ